MHILTSNDMHMHDLTITIPYAQDIFKFKHLNTSGVCNEVATDDIALLWIL